MTLRKPLSVPSYPASPEDDPMRSFVEARVSGGMITTIDPADIPTNALVEAKGCKLVYDKTSRSPGQIAFGPTKPNSNAILGLYSFKKDDGTPYLLRFTKSSVHKQAVSWTALTGALTGSDNNLFSFTFAFDQVYFANGVDQIQVIDAGITSFAALGNAPQYKYVATFYERIIGANYQGPTPNPNLLGCSGSLNFAQWNPATDFTSASYPLLETPSDSSDIINGLYSGPNYLIIPKEKTIWLATKTPSASNPFFPFTAVPDYGSDTPYGSCGTPYGLVFLNVHDKKVYLYQPRADSSDQSPVILSTVVEGEIFKNILDVNKVVASYNALDDSVTILISSSGTNTRRLWSYNFISKGWTFDEKDNVCYIADVNAGARAITIGDLVGTIGSATGTIGSASTPIGTTQAKRLYGYTTGELAEDSANSDVDIFNVPVTTILKSKKFSIPTNDIYVVRMRFEFDVKRYSAIQLQWSKDGISWITAKTFVCPNIDSQKTCYFNKTIKTRKIQWRLISITGTWDIIDYEIHVYDAGVSK